VLTQKRRQTHQPVVFTATAFVMQPPDAAGSLGYGSSLRDLTVVAR